MYCNILVDLVDLHCRVLLHGGFPSGFPLFFVRTVSATVSNMRVVRTVWIVNSVQEETSDFEIVEGQRIENYRR